jgi:hypothetical protein
MSQTTKNSLVLQLALFIGTTDYARVTELCSKAEKIIQKSTSEKLLEVTLQSFKESKGQEKIPSFPMLSLYAEMLFSAVPAGFQEAGATEEEVAALNHPVQRELLMAKSKHFQDLTQEFGEMEKLFGFDLTIQLFEKRARKGFAQSKANAETKEGGTEC